MNTNLISDIEKAASEHGSRPALSIDEKILTYRQLIEQTNKLANGFKVLGVKPGDSIGLFLDKSLEAVVAILATLKIGANYVPFDRQALQARHLTILTNCQIKTIVANSEDFADLKDLHAKTPTFSKLIFLDIPDTALPASVEMLIKNKLWVDGQSANLDVVEISQPEEQVATVLFTSGSTGTPKGALITPSNIRRFIDWVISEFDITHEDKLISHAPLFFDISLFDLFAGLCSGATVVLVPRKKIGNAAYLIKLVDEQKITIWQSAPSILRSLASITEHRPGVLNNLRHIVFSGEKLSGGYVRQLQKTFQSATFSNVYGCTETNDTFIYKIPNLDDVPDELPIGRPLPYVEYYCLGDDGNKSNEGELYVSCPTTMLGYINQSSDQSIFHFDDQGKRFYKTNDRVKKGSDGLVYLLERIDDIVKTNGYRVSLMEVETCLNQHSEIAQACVVAIDDDVLNKKIVAFMQLEKDSKLNSINIRKHCAKHVASYAIPQKFYINNFRFELTPSGKIDRKKLLNKANIG